MATPNYKQEKKKREINKQKKKEAKLQRKLEQKNNPTQEPDSI